MPQLPPTHPSQPEEVLPPFDIATVPETDDDAIPAQEVLPRAQAPAGVDASNLPIPRVVLGCATFGYGVYDEMDNLRSTMPVRVVRAALRAGMNAFDTAPHYHPSEIILGHALAALRDEFPRESYSIITKCAKYGAMVDHHVYDPEVVKASVERSLRRLQTDYIDVMYLHDVEFVASKPFPTPAGVHLFALGSESEAYGLSPEDAGTSFGPGDDSILACVAALRGLQSVGKIRRVGLAGYPLPVLLRLSRLVLARTGTPIDVVQTYAHQTVLCDTLGAFLPALAEARVPQVVSAAPLSMGLLTAGGGPAWHPARRVPALFDATREAVTLAREQGNGVSIEAAACAYGYKPLEHGGAPVPVVIGCTNLDQVHLTLRAFGEVQRGEVSADNLRVQEELVKLFEGRGVRNVSWQSPAPEAFPAEA